MRSAATALAGLLLSASLAGPTLATTEPSQAAGPANTATSSPASPVETPVADTTKPGDVSADQPAQLPAPPAAAESAAPSQPELAPAEMASPAQPAAPAADAAVSTPVAPATEPPAATAQQPAPEQPAQPQVAEESNLSKELLQKIADAKGISKDDREALTAFYQERGENLLWLQGANFTARAQAAMAEIRQADDWGLEASAFELPAAPTDSEPANVAEAELALSLAVIKYANHARGGRMDPRRLSNYIDRDLNLVPTTDLLAEVSARDDVNIYLRKLHPQHPQFEKLRQAYLALKAGTAPPEPEPEQAPAKGSKAKRAAAPEKVTERKLLVNMEQWRWMPEDWGQFHVWANIPEYTLRVSNNGHHIFTERIIVGKADTQTPIFSDEMAFLVFQPFWGVPDSIKMKEILPSLARGSSAALDKNNLRIRYRGRDIDPGSVDWSRTDIRNFHVYQPPGGGNVLGQVKFMFPNKHQVYMHDTPTKHLFNSSQRTFSHGCMRVRNPMRFAEVLLSQDKGWDKGRVAAQVSGAKPDNNVSLDTKIPVHMTYFTAWVEDDGKLTTYRDIYGHESRIQMGIEGKAHLIVKRKDELGPVRAEAIGRLAETRTGGGGGSFSSKNTPDWARRVFGN